MSKLVEVQEKVFNKLDQEQDYLVELTQKLVRYKSVNPKFIKNPESSEESQIQSFIKQELDTIGFSTLSFDAFPGRPNVVGQLEGQGSGKSLILNGHIDVVPEGDHKKWNFAPFSGDVDNDRIYGRGSCDMKGGVAAMIAAARAIREAGVDLSGRLELHTVVDEEAGGWGTRAIIDKGYKADAAIVCEPTWGDLYPAEGGLSWTRVTFTGASGHAGMRYAMIYPQPDDKDNPFREFGNGVNAIEKAVKFVQAVRELEREWALRKSHPLLPPGITTINPGVIVGGAGMGEDGFPATITNPAINPDVCVVEFDLKYLPTEEFEAVKQEWEEFVHAFAQTDPWLKENPPKVEWHVRGVDFPPVDTPVDHPIMTAMHESAHAVKLEPKVKGFFAVADAAFYAAAGIPTVIFGPSGGGFHGENEYVDIPSLHKSAKVYAGTILRWCDVA